RSDERRRPTHRGASGAWQAGTCSLPPRSLARYRSPMLTLPTYELLGLAALLSWWLALRLWRRRARRRLIEVERRFEATVQRFRVEVDRFKLTRQAAVKILLNHDHEVWTHVE